MSRKRESISLSQTKESPKVGQKGKSKSPSRTILSSTVSESEISKDDDSPKRGSAMAYQVLSKEDSKELLEMSAVEMERKLETVLKLTPATCLRDAAVLDYFVGAVYWGKQKKFDQKQLSGFFTVIHTLVHKMQNEQSDIVNLLKEYRKALIGIGVELSPEQESGGIEFFTVEQATTITDFIQSTLFQHFSLYEFMFTQNQFEEIVCSDLSVEVPMPADTPFPPPLDEGMSENTYRNFMVLPTPSTEETPTEGLDKTDEAGTMDEPSAELPEEAADLFAKLTPEDVKTVVEEVSKELLQSLQIGVESKIRGTENAILARINKIHNVLPENTPRQPDTDRRSD